MSRKQLFTARGWAISDTQARVAAPATVQIDPFKVMTSVTQQHICLS